MANRHIDLSQLLFDGCPSFPGSPPVEIRLLKSLRADGCNTELMSLTSHAGTHVDAPLHVLEGGASISDMPLDAFVGTAVPVDLYHKGEKEEIGPKDLEPHDGKIQRGDIVLLCTGWGQERATTARYLYNSPWLGKEGAGFLVKLGIKGVGIDHFAIGGGDTRRGRETHLVLMQAGIWIMEDMFLPRVLLERPRWYFVGVPLLIQGASGAPARAFVVDA